MDRTVRCHPAPARCHYAERIDGLPKYVASRTLAGPLDWNTTLIEDDVVQAVLVDEFWFWVNPHLWPAGPRILDGVGPIRLQLVAATPYRSGVVRLRYRPTGV